MAKKEKTVYCCRECGYETANWAGKCPSCGAWNSLAEVKLEPSSAAAKGGRDRLVRARPQRITELDTSEEIRLPTGIGELEEELLGLVNTDCDALNVTLGIEWLFLETGGRYAHTQCARNRHSKVFIFILHS